MKRCDFCLVASCWEGILKDVWALEKKMLKMSKNSLSSGWVSSFKSQCCCSASWWETKCECRFRIWTGRPFFRGRSRRRSSRPSEERKMSATLTWSSQLRLPPSRRPASAAPSIARSRTTSRILTMYPTSARVGGHRVLSCPLPATDSEMRRRSDGWLCPCTGRERETWLRWEARITLTLSFLSVCVCLRWMEDRLGRVCVTEDQRILIARYTHTQCHGSADPEISRSVTPSGF